MAVAPSKKVNIRGLVRQLKRKGYKIFTRPYELNIVGVRANSTIPDKFDDLIYVFYKTNQGLWKGKAYPATTDPGTYWLKNPMNRKGSAILKEGQYIDAWIRRPHNGTYMALGQEGPVTVWRDYDRDAVLDWSNGKQDTGSGFGINIHRASSSSKGNKLQKTIQKSSAGCQVFQNADDFDEFMDMVVKQKDLYGNKFSYTLIDERAYVRSLKRYGIYVLLGVGSLAMYVGLRTYFNKPLIPTKIKKALGK